MTEWAINGNYRDHEQVRQFYPAYLARYAELTAAGRYPYNDDFKGHISPDLSGKSEMTAIYLLQNTRHLEEHDAKVAERLADGWRELDRDDVTVTPERFAGVVEHGFCSNGTGWREWPNARLLRAPGCSVYVLPARARTQGHMTQGRLLVKD